MNEEEAIERLNRFKTIKVMYGNTFEMHLEQLKQLQQDLETILKLIEKQQYIIEGKECVIETQAHNEEVLNKIIDKKQAEIEKKDIALRECERNLIEERQNRIKEDKIINLMAEDIYGYQIECNRYFKDKEEVIKYFEKKAEEDK